MNVSDASMAVMLVGLQVAVTAGLLPVRRALAAAVRELLGVGRQPWESLTHGDTTATNSLRVASVIAGLAVAALGPGTHLLPVGPSIAFALSTLLLGAADEHAKSMRRDNVRVAGLNSWEPFVELLGRATYVAEAKTAVMVLRVAFVLEHAAWLWLAVETLK